MCSGWNPQSEEVLLVFHCELVIHTWRDSKPGHRQRALAATLKVDRFCVYLESLLGHL
jgi:hypothetical protein